MHIQVGVDADAVGDDVKRGRRGKRDVVYVPEWQAIAALEGSPRSAANLGRQ